MISSLRFLPLLLALSMTAPAATQPTAPAASLAEVRQQRADLLRDEIKSLDTRIESRLATIIGGLAQITDSKDSRTKVARLKEDTAKALGQNVTNYQRRRAALLEELRRPTLQITAEQKRQIIAALDARIEKRVAQILELQKSFPTHKDYDRYEVTGSRDWGTEYKVNDDFRQNQRVTAHTDQMRDKVIASLRQSITRLEQQNRTLAATPGMEKERAQNDAMLAERRKQLKDAVENKPAVVQRAVSQKEAQGLDQALRQATEELRREFTTLFARYNVYLPALAEANAARAQAAAPRGR